MNAGKIPVITVLLSLLSFFILPDCVQAKYSGGSGTAGDPYRIGSAANLLVLAADANDYNKPFILTADINLAPYNFTTAVIAPDTNNSASGFQGVQFSGIFDGNGYTISNLTINTGGAGNDFLGLFGFVTSGEIKNLRLEDVNITGDDNSICLGGLVGNINDNSGIISNCYSSGAVTGGDNSEYVGGLVGFNNYGTISNCYSTGNVSGGSGSTHLGGLVGWNNDSIISDCYSTGDVSGGDNSGYLGGLVGQNNSGGISSCYSTGTVTGGNLSAALGGLVGWNINASSISNCYSTGNVTGTSGVGGLVGSSNSSISNCYSTGAVTGTSDFGGLVGFNSSGTINSCYFPVTEPNNGLGTMLTDAQMKQQKSFIGWDFIGETVNGPNDVWWINKGVSYPKLYWQPNVTKCTVTAGSKVNSDKISFSGTIGASADDFNDANVIEITINSNDIVSPCDLTFPIDANTFKKGKYNYSKTANGVKKSFTYDLKTRKFAFSASNVDLSGLGCPVTIEIEVGDYYKTAEIDEVIVNGPRVPIPILLMMGVKDVLRVDKCQVKHGKDPDTDQLSVKGAFAVRDMDVNMVEEEFVASLDAQTFTLPAGSFKAGKGKFTCSKAQITGCTADATFNFNLCSFILTIKNTNIPVISGDVDFGAAFADFNEVDRVTFP